MRRNIFLTCKVIAFSGIDGSGKSVHAHELIRELESQGKSVKYLWMRGRGRTLFSFPLLVLCRLLKITKVHKLRSGIQVSEYLFYAYKPLRLLWPWLQLIDSLIYTLVLIRLPLARSYDILIIDRSFIDTLVDVISDTRSPFGMQTLQKLFLALLPRNSLVIILDIDERIAIARKKDIPNKHYLNLRRKVYNRLAQNYGWHVVSTKSSFNESHSVLLSIISDWSSQQC